MNFTEDETFLLTSLPALIGSVVSQAEDSGVIDTVKEALAMVKTISSGTKQFPNNRVIQSILPAIEDRAAAIERAKSFQTKTIGRLKEKGIRTKEQLKEQLLADCGVARRILTDKATPQECKEFKEWVMQIAQQVATAAKEGGFLGIGGEYVNPGEVKAIREIANALEAEPALIEA